MGSIKALVGYRVKRPERLLDSSLRRGAVTTYQPNGKNLVSLATTFYGGDFNTGGMINVYNKTGEDVVQMYANEYGKGLVGAFNRKGKGRTLNPGP